MRKLCVFILMVTLVLSLTACYTPGGETIDESHYDEIHAMLRDANIGITSFVYDVSFTNHLAFEASGSGVIYKEQDGYLYALTNYHVVNPRDYNYAEYYIHLLNQDAPLVGELIAFDEMMDLAVIRFRPENAEYSLVNISLRVEDPLQEGEFVLAFGKPSDNTYYRGEYLGMVTIDSVDFNVLYHSANVITGFSGGALTDIHGNLIGINTWSTTGNTGLAVGIQEIYAFLASNNLLPE